MVTHIHSHQPGHASLCLHQERPNSFSSTIVLRNSINSSPSKILAAGPRHKTDKQEGNLAEVGEGSTIPFPLAPWLLAWSLGHLQRCQFSVCPYVCPLCPVPAPDFPLGTPLTHPQAGLLSARPGQSARAVPWPKWLAWEGRVSRLVRSAALELFLEALSKEAAPEPGLLGWWSVSQDLWASAGESLSNNKAKQGSRLERRRKRKRVLVTLLGLLDLTVPATLDFTATGANRFSTLLKLV